MTIDVFSEEQDDYLTEVGQPVEAVPGAESYEDLIGREIANFSSAEDAPIAKAGQGISVMGELQKSNLMEKAQTIVEQDIDLDSKMLLLDNINKLDMDWLNAQFTAIESVRAAENPDYAFSMSETEFRNLRKQNAAEAASKLRAEIERNKAESGVVGDTLDVAGTLVAPDFYIGLFNSINSALPGFEFTDRLDMQGTIEELARYIKDADPEESKRATDVFLSEITKRRGFLFDNAFAGRTMIEPVLNALEGNSSDLENLFAVAEYLSLVPAVGGLVKGGVKLIKGTLTKDMSKTLKGQDELLRAADEGDPEALKALNTTEEEVVGEFNVPNMDEVETGPYLSNSFISPEAAQAAQEAHLQGLSARGVKLNHGGSKVKEIDGGYEYEAIYNKSNGTGWVDQKRAAARAEELGGVVIKDESTNTFMVKVTGKQFYDLGDVGALEKAVKAGGSLMGYFGKALAFSEHIVRSGNVAALKSARTEGALRQTLKPYTDLGRLEQTAVNAVIDEGDSLQKWFNLDELRLKGLNEKQVEGYNAYRKLSERNWSIRNTTARAQLVQRGFKFTTIKDQEVFLKSTDEIIPQNDRVINLETGQVESAANLGTDVKKYRLNESYGKSKAIFAYEPKGYSHLKEAIPTQVIKKLDGYLTRKYTTPYFIRQNGETIRTAPSEKAALKWKEAAENPDDIEILRASEISDEGRTFDELDDLRRQGLLRTSHRNPETITDVTGDTKLMPVHDSINAMVSSASNAAGVRRWAQAMEAGFDKTYKWKFNEFHNVSRPRNIDEAKQWDDAKQVYDHVMRSLGLNESQLGNMTRTLRNRVADMLWNSGNPIGRAVGDEISGLNKALSNTAKSVTFAAYLALNPLRQLIMQTTMIPTYMGIEGASKYMLSPRYWADMTAMMADDFDKAAGKALLARTKADPKLIEDFEASGLKQAVTNHVTTIDTFSDARVAKGSGLIGRSVENVVNAGKAMGFDFGLKAEKRAAWLVARNRFITRNGRSPNSPREWEDVNSFAEQLGLNQNRTDTLVTQHGVLSILTQFMSHQIKSMGRVVGTVTGRGEVGFTKAERLRMLAASTLAYGTGGYGVSNLIGKMSAETGVNIPEDAKLALEQGINGYLVNAMFRLADEDGDPTELAFSESFGPFSSVVGGNKGLIAMFKGILDLDAKTLIEATPAIGLGGRVLDVVDFAWHLGGAVDMPVQEEALAITAKTLKVLPIFNNVFKALAANNIGYHVDSRGRPVVEAAKGEAIAALLGIKASNIQEVYDTLELINGEFVAQGEAGIVGEVRNAAKETANWLEPMLRHMGEGKIDMSQVRELIKNHNITVHTAIGETYVNDYYTALRKELSKRNTPKADALVEHILRSSRSGAAQLDNDLVEDFKQFSFEGSEKIVEYLESMIQLRGIE